MLQTKTKLGAIMTILVCAGVFFAFQNQSARAAVGINKRINFQGKVTNTDGTNVTNNSYNFLFCVYTVASPASPCTAGANNDAVWRESKSLTVTDGIFQTNLGDTTPFAALIDFNSDNIYLGINFNSNGQMSPLVQFTSSPYSFNSDLLDGGDWAVPGAIGSTTRNSALFTTLGANGNTTLASTGGATMTLGNSTGAATVASGGTSSWTNTSGNLTFQTTTSGILALTSAGALNLSAGAASTVTLPNVANAWNYDSNTLSIDALNNRIGIGTNAPSAFLDLAGSTTGAASLQINAGSDPSAPNIGDMWFNGTSLYFRKDGSTSQDLLLSGGGGYSTIKDESTSLTQRSTLAFLGSGINCVDNIGQTECTISAGGTGPWTDGVGISYLTDGNEDLAIGGATLASPFSVDVSTNTVRVGSGSTANGKLDMYASDGDTGSIEYTANDSWNFEGGNVSIGAQDAQSMLQVGDKTNRGNAEVYGEIIKKGLISTKAISGTISDVFVYDTTRDPDGGRWTDREQSQGLSWYAETKDNTGESCVLASNDRCGDSAFPSKAVVVATSDAVYIFDANRNTMWMKFTQAGTYTLGADSNNNPSSVFALYGVVYVATNGSSATGMYAIDFMNDRIYNYDSVDRTLGNNNISNRNSATTYASGITSFAIGNNTSSVVNDVHGAILSGSSSILTNGGPGNGFTYLCAATEDGVSVINLSGGFTLDYGDNLTDAFSACFVTKRARLYAINKTLAQVERYGQNASGVINIDTAYANQAAPTDVWDEQTANYPHVVNSVTKTAAPVINAYPDTLEVIERASFAATGTEATTPYGDVIYVGHGGGLTEIHDVEAPSTTLIGWSKEYTSDYETSYMSGNPRGNFVFNEASGLIYDKTIRNSTLAAPVAPTYGVNGVHGTGMNFNGTSQYLCSDTNATISNCEADTDFNVAATSFHIEAWFRHTVGNPVTTNDVLVDKRYTAFAGTEGIGYTIEMNTSGQMVFGIQDTAATAAYDDSVTSTD